ncbi:MAG: HAD-IA family hydrolase [Pseudomonadota bacterium]
MTSSNPTAVFDLDGTLIDTAPDLVDAVNAVLQVEKIGTVSTEDLHHLVGHGGRAMIKAAYGKFGHDADEALIDRLIPVFIDAYAANMPGQSKPYPGVIELIDSLRSEGWICAVCTNKMKRLADPLLEALQLTSRFASVSGGDTYPFKKPDPRHITQTILEAGGNPKKAVMFGDSENDIVAAQGANIPVIAVDFGYTPVHVREFQPTKIISSYSDLTVADVTSLLNAD